MARPAAPKPDKNLLKKAVSKHYQTIQAAEAVVGDLITEAAPAIKELVAHYGAGPHKFRNEQGIYLLTFRADGDQFTIKRTAEPKQDEDITDE